MDNQHVRDVPVLVIEDNPDDVLLIQRAFSRAKLATPLRVVENGEQAVAYLTGFGPYADRTVYPQPLLILLDLKLPLMSGLEVLAWRRQQAPQLQRIPVVVLTSSRESSDVNRAYELGANTYLLKPVRFQELLELVKQLGVYWIMLAELPEAPDL